MEAIRLLPPSDSDVDLARKASSKIVPFAREHKSQTIHLTVAEGREAVVLPAGSLAMFSRILEAMAAGHGVTIIPQHAELTTMEAADILNVSRPYLIKLLKADKIPYRKVGTHRRILMEGLLAYKEKTDRESRAAMDELVALSEELGLYDL